MVEEPNGKLGPTSTSARVGIPTEEESERPLPIDGVHKGWTRLDVAGLKLPRPRAAASGGIHHGHGWISTGGLTNSFHVSMKRSREGMGRGKGRPVAAVYAAPRRVPQTLGPTQTRERHTKLERGVTRERHNKSYTREKGGWE